MKKILFIIVISLFLSGCAIATPNPVPALTLVGFIYGFWHGLICWVSLICNIFDKSMAVYATYNNGFWYNLGFILGVKVNLTITFSRKINLKFTNKMKEYFQDSHRLWILK